MQTIQKMRQYENSIIYLVSTKTKLVSQNVSYICYFQCHLGLLTSLSSFFFKLKLNLSSIWAVWKTSRVIKTDGSEKSRAINKSKGSIGYQICLVRKQPVRNVKLTWYSYCICTFCNLHCKNLVLDGKWRRVNHILGIDVQFWLTLHPWNSVGKSAKRKYCRKTNITVVVSKSVANMRKKQPSVISCFLNKTVMVFGIFLAGPGQASDNTSNNYQNDQV